MSKAPEYNCPSCGVVHEYGKHVSTPTEPPAAGDTGAELTQDEFYTLSTDRQRYYAKKAKAPAPPVHTDEGELKDQIVDIMLDEDKDPGYVTGWHLDVDKAADKILVLVAEAVRRGRWQELDNLLGAMADDPRPNADWYREPFQCVHDLVQPRLAELAGQAEEGTE